MYYNNKGRSRSLLDESFWSCTYTLARWSKREVGTAGIVPSMEWWAIYHEWRSFIRIQRPPTAPWTCHCAQEDQDYTGANSMI